MKRNDEFMTEDEKYTEESLSGNEEGRKTKTKKYLKIVICIVVVLIIIGSIVKISEKYLA